MMKKFLSSLVITALALILVPTVNANTQSPTVKLDGKIINFPDVKPYINEDERTMVPVRFVTEAMGCKVDWEETNQLVIITKAPKRIVLRIGENSAIVNSGTSDERKVFDTKAVLVGERTMVPLRFVSETLGAGVAWDEVNNTVIIRSDGVVEIVPIPKPTPVPTPTSWRNVEVPMTLTAESDPMPEGFIKPKFVIKHHPDGRAGYFEINLTNILEYKDVANDYAYKITCTNYDLLNWTSGIPEMFRTDTINNLSGKFKRARVNEILWSAPSIDYKFNNRQDLGIVEIRPGVVIDMSVEFYYCGLKYVYRDSVELKSK